MDRKRWKVALGTIYVMLASGSLLCGHAGGRTAVEK